LSGTSSYDVAIVGYGPVGAVFANLTALGGTPPYTVVIGCEIDSVEEGIGLSDAVGAAVPEAVRAIEIVVADLLARSTVGKG